MEESVLEICISRRFYLQAIRELVTNKESGIYLFDEDLIALFQIHAWDNRIVINNPVINGVRQSCHFEVVLEEGSAHFTNYHENNAYFLAIMEKYRQPVPEEFRVYLSNQSSEPPKKEEGAPEAEQQLKPKSISSQPSFFNSKVRRASLAPVEESSRKPTKQPSAPLLLSNYEQSATASTHDAYDICTVMKRYSKKVLMLHALIYKEAFDFFKAMTDIKLTRVEQEFIKKAKKYHTELQRCKVELQRQKPKRESGSLIKMQGASLRLSTPEMGIFGGSPPRAPSPSSRTPSPPQRKGSSDHSSRVVALEQEIRLNAIQYIVFAALEDENPNFVLEVFESFGDRRYVIAKIFNAGELNKLMLPQNKKFGDNLMGIMACCFNTERYNPRESADGFSCWIDLVCSYINFYKCLPECFSGSDVLGKLLSGMNDLDRDKFIRLVEMHQLLAALREKVLIRLAQKQDTLLARVLVKTSLVDLAKLLRGSDSTHYFFSLLMVRDKKVDLALLADSAFIDFIQHQETVLGYFIYAQLLERIKSHFDFKNLLEDGEDSTDMRETQSAGRLLMRDQEALRASTAFKFLSDSEISNVFLMRELPAKKHGAEGKWLGIYGKNLSLILLKFLPHLPRHLGEISVLYRQYYDQVIGRLSNRNRKEKYKPEIHELKNFPKEMVAYIETGSAECDQFKRNIAELAEVYPDLCALEDGTVRMDKHLQSGFTPATCVADKILEAVKVIGRPTKFTRATLGQRISIHMMQFVQETFGDTGRPENICTDATLKNVHDSQFLWLKVDLADALVEKFKQVLAALKNSLDDSYPDNAFADALKSALDDFCKEYIQARHNEAPAVVRKLSLGAYN